MSDHMQQMMKTLPESSFTPVRTGKIQRKQRRLNGLDEDCPGCRKELLNLQRSSTDVTKASSVPPVVNEVLNSPGESLDPETRAFMEPYFGHDFSKVRVHTDEKAAESARAVNALAYTVGNDIVFGPSQYAPGVVSGKRLLAHELTHVVQQGRHSSVGNVVHRVPANLDYGIIPPQFNSTERLLALIVDMEKVYSYTTGKLESIKSEETKGETGNIRINKETKLEGQDLLDNLKDNIEKLKSIANGEEESLKLSVLSAFTPQKLAQAEAQLNFVPRPAVTTEGTAIRIQERTPVGIATMPISISDPHDPAEVEANRVAYLALTNGFTSVRQTGKQNVINRQIGPALVAAGSGLLVVEGEAAPLEAASGPPGWVVGAAITLTAVALIGAGYLLTRSKVCPPCPINPPIEIDRVPPSDPHFPCPGDHWHYRVYNQNPQTCQCFLSGRLFGGCCHVPGAPC